MENLKQEVEKIIVSIDNILYDDDNKGLDEVNLTYEVQDCLISFLTHKCGRKTHNRLKKIQGIVSLDVEDDGDDFERLIFSLDPKYFNLILEDNEWKD